MNAAHEAPMASLESPLEILAQATRVCPHLALQQINMQAIRIIDL